MFAEAAVLWGRRFRLPIDSLTASRQPAAAQTPCSIARPQQPAPKERIGAEDVHALELAKARLETSQAQANEAAARLEAATMTYRYIILQIYMKNNMGQSDALSENGDIIRGGATQQR